MESQEGRIRVTVVADNGSRESTPRTVTIAAREILSVEAAVPNERSTTADSHCRIVLVETVQTRVPWVFSDEDDHAPPPHRALLVHESLRVVTMILRWAQLQPTAYSADHVRDHDDWVNNGMPLTEDLIVPRPIQLRTRRGPVRPTGE